MPASWARSEPSTARIGNGEWARDALIGVPSPLPISEFPRPPLWRSLHVHRVADDPAQHPTGDRTDHGTLHLVATRGRADDCPSGCADDGVTPRVPLDRGRR